MNDFAPQDAGRSIEPALVPWPRQFSPRTVRFLRAGIPAFTVVVLINQVFPLSNSPLEWFSHIFMVAGAFSWFRPQAGTGTRRKPRGENGGRHRTHGEP